MLRWRTVVAASLAVAYCSCGRGVFLGEDEPQALRIRPETLDLYPGQRVAMEVDGLYWEAADGGYRQRAVSLNGQPELILWTASSRVALVEPGPVLAAVAAGRTRLAAYFAGRQAEVEVAVSAHPLYHLDARPDQLELTLGEYGRLAVHGLLTDGSEIDLTAPAFGTLYASADPTVAGVTSEGLVFAQADGRTEILVRHGDFSDRVQVKAGSGRSLYAIELVPARLDLMVGESGRLQLIGRFTDQSEEDLTSHPQTRLKLEDSKVAALQPGGLVVALAGGQTTVQAYHRDFSSVADIVVHEPKLLVDLQTLPEWLRLQRGEVAQLSVQAVYLGGELQDVTGRAEFVTADPDIAGVSPGGLVTGVGAGRTGVRASFAGRTAVCALNVEQPLARLRLHPAVAVSDVGEQLYLQVYFLQAGLPEQEVTAQAAFRSNAPQVAAVYASGRVESLAPGLASVLVSWQGLEGAAQITVRQPTP